jgi:hypothetical protein
VALYYDLVQLLTERAVVERDLGALDGFGGEPKVKREVVATLPCRFWWAKVGETGRSPMREYATPERSIHLSDGGILLEVGANIRAGDRIKEITDLHGNQLIEGNWRVISLLQIEDHLEAGLMRP